MHALYIVSVWLHILAATVWIGGMFFVVLVVVPWLRRGDGNAGKFLRETGERFRSVGWTCFAILLVTGTFNLWIRGVRFGNFVRREWLATSFGHAIVIKLSLFVGVLVVSVIHDFFVGPRAAIAIAANDPSAAKLRRQASLLGRVNALLALAIVAAAVIIVRGSPF
jgi:putative copper export protein